MTQKFLMPTGIEDEGTVILASRTPKKRAGRRVFKETRHPVYRGVRMKNHGKWVCELRNPKTQKRVWLGTYSTLEMAARAHDVAALAFRGRLACLNFADSAWRLKVPVSTETEDIQKAAAEAAEMFRCEEEEKSVIETETETDSSGSSSNKAEERSDTEINSSWSNYSNTLEETEFDMQGWVMNMTAEPMMSPPHQDFSYIEELEMEYSDVDVSLWSYSMSSNREVYFTVDSFI